MDQKGLIVITGAGSGIGKAIAQLASEKGYPLLLIDRSGRARDLGLPRSLSMQVDVSDLDSFQRAIRSAEEMFGPVMSLINNAGVMLLGEMQDQDPSEWTTMLNTNVLGVMNGIKSALEGMISRRSGTIMNVSSIAGFKGFPNHAIYCATKFAVHGLTETLRQETAKHNLRFITISPGVVETELLDHTTSSQIKDNYKDWKTQIGGGLDADDVARAVMFALEQPERVCIREIVIAPTAQEL